MTSHLEESIITGTRQMSGSVAISLMKRSIAATPSIMPSSMLTSMTCAPASTCWRATDERGVVVAGLDQVAEPGGAGDVGALADVDEQRVLGDVQRLEARRAAAPARSPAGTRGGLAVDGLGDRGDVRPASCRSSRRQVDQAGRRRTRSMIAGGLLGRLVVLAERVGQAGVRVAGDEASRRSGPARRCRAASPSAPSAQLRPTASGRACRTEFQNASVTWPDSVRPEASVMVPGDDHRPAAAALLEQRLDGEDRRLGVEGVEDRLDEEQVGAAVDQAARLLEVGRRPAGRR